MEYGHRSAPELQWKSNPKRKEKNGKTSKSRPPMETSMVRKEKKIIYDPRCYKRGSFARTFEVLALPLDRQSHLPPLYKRRAVWEVW